MDETRSATLNLRIAPSIKEKAAELARADRRSLSSFIEKLILDAAKKAERQK